MSEDAGINWMYEGAKGNVHREDYLLGKKIDKNFEKYSDVVNAQKVEAIDSIVSTRTVFNSGQNTGLKTTSLQKDIIKSEDPFVAVRVREETKRRELMDNPLMKARLQSMLKTMMTSKNEKKKEKKNKKEKKDKKKKHKKRSRSSSDSSGDDEPKTERRRSPSPKRKRRTSDISEDSRCVRRRDSSDNRTRRRSRSRSVERSRNNRRDSRSPIRKRSRSRSAERHRSSRHRSRSRSAERTHKRSPQRRPRSRSIDNDRRSPKRSRDEGLKQISRKDNHKSRSRSRSVDKPSSSNSKSSRQFDSHVPKHLQGRKSPSSSDSDSDRDRHSKHDDRDDSRKKSYGLVEMRKRTSEEREAAARGPSKEYKLIKIPTGRGGNTSNKREPRKALTEEEKAARLAEMQANVEWRDEVRKSNVAKARIEDEDEKEEADKNGYAPSFIRNQMRDACDDMTVEKRLQSNKRGVQRSHGYMDRSFAKK